jgi:hypothetical protein
MVKVFILVLFFHVGPWGKSDSNTSTTVPGFITEQECVTAGEKASSLVTGTRKEVRYICVEQTKEAK